MAGRDSLTRPDTKKSASPPRTPETHTPPHTQMETERQTLWSWAELLLPPSPPALTARATFSGRKSNHVLQPSVPPPPPFPGSSTTLGSWDFTGPPPPNMSCSCLTGRSLLLGPGSQDTSGEVSGHQTRPVWITGVPSKPGQSLPCIHDTLKVTDSFSAISSQGPVLTRTSYATPSPCPTPCPPQRKLPKLWTPQQGLSS